MRLGLLPGLTGVFNPVPRSKGPAKRLPERELIGMFTAGSAKRFFCGFRFASCILHSGERDNQVSLARCQDKRVIECGFCALKIANHGSGFSDTCRNMRMLRTHFLGSSEGL